MNDEIYVLEWSRSQLQFHVQRLADLITWNRSAYRDDRALNDYHILHMGTRSECEDVAQSCRPTLHIRRMAAEAIAQASRRAA
jgi:hypothetical protein